MNVVYHSGAIGVTLAAIMTGAVAVAVLWPIHGRVLAWDEVNYANVGAQGLVANWLELGSLSTVDFLRFADAKRRGTEPSLPPGYDEERDPFLLRHQHPPFVVYLVAAFVPAETPADERLVRAPQLLGALALPAAVLVGYRSISSSPTLAGVLVVALLAFWADLVQFRLLSFHGWQAVWSVATATLVAGWLKSRRWELLTALAMVLAASLLTLETAAAIWLAALLAAAVWSPIPRWGRRGLIVRYISTAVAISGLLTLLAWPGAVFGFSLAKIPLYYFYRYLRGQIFFNAGDLLPAVLMESLPVIVWVLPVLVLLSVRARGAVATWGPYVVVGIVYLAATARFAVNTSYIVPGLTPLICLIGVAVDSFRTRAARLSSLLLAGALVVGVALPLLLPHDPDYARSDLAWASEHFRGREVLADGGHIFRYYLVSYSIRSIMADFDGTLVERREGQYWPVTAEDIRGKLVIVREKGLSRRPEEELLRDCIRIDRPTFRVYECDRLR